MPNAPAAEPHRRLFIGLIAPPEVRETVLAWRAGWQWPRGVAFSAPAHWHLTLHFLGDTPESTLPALQDALATVRFSRFTLRLGQPEAWPRGLVVLRPEPEPRLDALHAQVLQAVQACGLAADAGLPWKPHLTLARKAGGAVPPTQALATAWTVDALSLVWSRLPPSVPRTRYEEIGRWPANDGVTPSPSGGG
ncbi:RNA 2',3'-cyclic phosphodiesterase [Ramlibacter rhizophilus]|uniref:RNA 2',3'-cyclic phosphodiesterase n=1 Tax=Ramlibacter rhizophilus TaxID=1781167 RepID=A0A4Z0BZ72_9BURK|nr:RNA 2',3'-cyclic phosphodiesterase [Ramlibacter rhizophilus]TFZ03315.1 RNA 2',3'-cyclic phosphodiesterase [Ramlibacter rhizophilus]